MLNGSSPKHLVGTRPRTGTVSFLCRSRFSKHVRRVGGHRLQNCLTFFKASIEADVLQIPACDHLPRAWILARMLAHTLEVASPPPGSTRSRMSPLFGFRTVFATSAGKPPRTHLASLKSASHLWNQNYCTAFAQFCFRPTSCQGASGCSAALGSGPLGLR